jgi:hypothetical protein
MNTPLIFTYSHNIVEKERLKLKKVLLQDIYKSHDGRKTGSTSSIPCLSMV